MNENELDLNIPEISFEEPTEQPAQAEAGVPGAEAIPSPQPQQGLGFYSQRIMEQLNAAKAAYQQALEQKKKLMEAGYSVPVELDAQISQYAAKLAYLEGSLEDAKRRDALALIPGVVASLTADLPPEIGKVVAQKLKASLEQAASASPEILQNKQALQFALEATLGAIAKQRLAQKKSPLPTTPQAQSSPTPPPQQGQGKVEMPEIAKRLGISEKAWAAVSDEPESELDIF